MSTNDILLAYQHPKLVGLRQASSVVRALACAAGLALMAGGCSGGMLGLGGDDGDSAAAQREGGEERPNLASVPGERPETSSREERQVIYQGLYNDRSNARHVDGPVASKQTQTASAARADLSEARIVSPRNRQEVEFEERRERALNELAGRLDLTRVGNRIARIQFTPGQTTLPAGSGKTVISAGRFATATNSTLLIIGHTVIHGDESDDVLQARSLKRAQSVANGLRGLGFPADRLRVVGRGRSQPVTQSQENDSANSRVDIFYRLR